MPAAEGRDRGQSCNQVRCWQQTVQAEATASHHLHIRPAPQQPWQPPGAPRRELMSDRSIANTMKLSMPSRTTGRMIFNTA